MSTLPVKMITPTSGSSRAKSNARFSSITVRGLNAFLRSGLLMVICRTAHKSDRYIHTGNSSHNTRPSMSQICAHSISLRPTDRYLHLPRTKRKEIRAQRENLSLSLSLSLSDAQFRPILANRTRNSYEHKYEDYLGDAFSLRFLIQDILEGGTRRQERLCPGR